MPNRHWGVKPTRVLNANMIHRITFWTNVCFSVRHDIVIWRRERSYSEATFLILILPLALSVTHSCSRPIRHCYGHPAMTEWHCLVYLPSVTVKARSHIRCAALDCAALRCVALVVVELVETEKKFSRAAQRSVCVNGSIEIHVVTSTSAAQRIPAQRTVTCSRTAQRIPAQRMCERFHWNTCSY